MSSVPADIQCIRFQNNEFLALENIYLDEFHPIKESYPHKFNILCYPYRHPSTVIISNSTTNCQAAEYQIKLTFQFTTNYPKSPLKYQIEPMTGLTRDNVSSITNSIQEIIHSNPNRPIVYDIVEQIREWIQEYLVEGRAYRNQKDLEEFMNRKKAEQHFERPKFAAFTPVTAESFLAWKKQFDLKYKQKKQQKKEKQGEIKVTGKEWFLGRKDEIEEDQDEDDEDYDDEEEYQEQEDEEEVKKEEATKKMQERDDLAGLF